MPAVPGLRSPYAKVGRLVYFGRMLDKIRLHAAGRLPVEYQANLGDDKPYVFGSRCCRFLGVRYADLKARTLQGGADLDVLVWCEARGILHTDDECQTWNRFMMKIGWRDERSAALQDRIREYGLAGKPIETGFDLIDYDEGRDPVAAQAWLECPPAGDPGYRTPPGNFPSARLR
jgi:gluconokinase